MQLSIQPGDRVCFNADTIRRTAHDPWIVAFVGTVEGLYCGGRVAEISTNQGIRSVPVNNLAKVTKAHGIIDPSY
jgi:hypothetical protein